MTRNNLLYPLWILLLPLQLMAGPFDGVQGLIARRAPWLSGHVRFQEISRENGLDVAELQTVNGVLVVRASGANAAAVGINRYLEEYCHRSMSHMGDNLAPVAVLPAVREPVKINATAEYRYALNYCTYNYTMSFYDWNDWSHELDWMALHGVNTMLVANGEEAVWQNTLKRLGYTEKEISGYISGPAFNAWWLMGNLQGWGGPMPQGQIDSRRVLVQRMLDRMQALGIEPVMPGFYGMVPTSLKNRIKAHIVGQGQWAGGFERPDILDPCDTAFDRIADIFYGETRKLYGENIRFFSGDPFHEGGVSTGIDLGKAGARIQKAMQRSFPGAIWVLQGWQANPRKEMLAGTDKSAVLIQELFGEKTNNWEIRMGYEGTPFIWCTVTNFGERTGVNGKLQRFADEVYRASNGPFAGEMRGVGIMPEGIDNNPAAYDLALELGWHKDKVDVDQWITKYLTARYGKTDKDIQDAWKLLLQTAYRSAPGHNEGSPENILCARPSLEITSVSSWGTVKKDYDVGTFAQAVKLFARAAPRFSSSETYKLDLINFTRQVLANSADTVFARIVEAYGQKDLETFSKETGRFLQMEDETDDLLNADAFYRLSTYELQALHSGNTPGEKKNNLRNLMMLVTYWGADDRTKGDLHDYAYKEWGGMMRSFYKVRWEQYFAYLKAMLQGRATAAPDFFSGDRKWVNDHLRQLMP